MNVESLKTELQQVLDNDVLLRKEFNSLKRSLSDYRNQLIMRDEDCKRLQVTIDVLNTKLVVMERDNTSYKSELSSFKELRGSIREQLDDKQVEIDARLSEIQALRSDLEAMSASYEASMEELKASSAASLDQVRGDYEAQIQSLKSNAHYIESGIREEYENRLTELSNNWANQEQSLVQRHEETLRELLSSHEETIEALKKNYESQIATLSSGSSDEVAQLQEAHLSTLAETDAIHTSKFESMSSVYQQEIAQLQSALEEQRLALTAGFELQIESLQSDLATKERDLLAGFESHKDTFEASRQEELSATVSSFEVRMTALVAEYEEKLANTLIHSNAQNSKLNDELAKTQEEQAAFLLQISAFTEETTAQVQQITDLQNQLQQRDVDLVLKNAEVENLQNEFQAFQEQAQRTESEKLSELVSRLELQASEQVVFVGNLENQISSLSAELSNLALVLEKTTNELGEAENTIELKNQELLTTAAQVEELNARFHTFSLSFEEKEAELESFKAEVRQAADEKVKTAQVEFDKLLAENGQLIGEIDSAQDKVEAQDYEISLLKAELQEIRISSAGKSDFFKETLANRNFEITNLEANNAALTKEVQLLKEELQSLQMNLQETAGGIEALPALKLSLEEKLSEISALRSENDALLLKISQFDAEKAHFEAELEFAQGLVGTLNEQISNLNATIAQNETDLRAASQQVNTEHEVFVDKLFLQIDELNDQRLALLDEKEQMANQLLKMNEVIGTISQRVDAEQIDVTGLNNHRKNVILANNSGAASNPSPMKEQINDLVREIDKCIALLSA